MKVLRMIVCMPKRLKFSDQIRKAINESGMSRYRICKEMNFSESVMCKFMKEQSGLAIDTLDRLAELIGLSIVTNKTKASGGRASKPKGNGRKQRQLKGR